MAEPVVKIKSQDHRRRKNPRSADLYAEARKVRNRARGKQRWVGGTTSEVGHWERP